MDKGVKIFWTKKKKKKKSDLLYSEYTSLASRYCIQVCFMERLQTINTRYEEAYLLTVSCYCLLTA